MSNALLKSNGIYGATVAHKPVFTTQGALEGYNAVLEVCYKSVDIAGSIVLSEAQDDMVKLGFSWEELDSIEVTYLKQR